MKLKVVKEETEVNNSEPQYIVTAEISIDTDTYSRDIDVDDFYDSIQDAVEEPRRYFVMDCKDKIELAITSALAVDENFKDVKVNDFNIDEDDGLWFFVDNTPDLNVELLKQKLDDILQSIVLSDSVSEEIATSGMDKDGGYDTGYFDADFTLTLDNGCEIKLDEDA